MAPELDLFAMRPSDAGSATPSAEAPAIAAPPPPSTNTTTTAAAAADSTAAATTESAAAPTLDIFGGKVLWLSLVLLTVR